MSKPQIIKSGFTAIVQKEGDGFVSICPELDVVSQGDTVEQARSNLKEAVELFLETASEKEIEDRMHSETYISSFGVAIG